MVMMFKVVSQNGQGSSNVDYGDTFHTINPTSLVCDIHWDHVDQSIAYKANLFNILQCNNGPHRQNVGGGRLLSSLTPIVVVLSQLIESC